MSDEHQMREEKIEVRKARNSPKHSRATWDQIKIEFEDGSYTSQAELSKKYGINPITLRGRILRERWNEKRTTLQNKVQQKMEEVKVDIGTEYLKSTFLRAKRWEKIIDKSIDQVGECLEPQDANALSQTEARTHALALSALRLPATVQPLDITSRGLSIGESIVTAIQKLRDNPSAIVEVSSADVDRVLEMEVVDEPPK